MALVESFHQFVNDERYALELQLSEIEAQRELQSGKWPEHSPPDPVLAYEDFESELQKLKLLIEDVNLAHSIAKAVETDAVVLEEISAEETQLNRDRAFARSLDEDGNWMVDDTLPEGSTLGANLVDWHHVLRATAPPTLSMGSHSTVAGPSNVYTYRQQAVLEHLPSLKVECSVCGDSVHPHLAIRLACKDVYCKQCLKDYLLRVARDESLYPPKCHRQPISTAAIEANLSQEELDVYRCAELEFTSTDRVYCANPECAKFIPLLQRNPDRATCQACEVETCMHCKGTVHDGDCPEDEARQSFMTFADEQGWRLCFSCGRMFVRTEGCDHMSCRCGTEFCYRCGTKWKECSCSDWVPELRNQRAVEVVDREARFPMAPAVRQRRIVDMEAELQDNHECNHSGKFTKLERTTRHGKDCELCGATHWKYLLSCKRCHLLACEDCRRYRL